MAKVTYEVFFTVVKSISVEVDVPEGLDPTSYEAKEIAVDVANAAPAEDWDEEEIDGKVLGPLDEKDLSFLDQYQEVKSSDD